MNHILKYLSFVLFGIIIYLLLKNISKEERFSIGMQGACSIGSTDCINTNICNSLPLWTCNGVLSYCNFNFSLDGELNWSTCKNPCCMPMIIDYHDQGDCGTCSLYSVASLLECMYNIKVFQENRMDELSKISISPQSIIDILGRYRPFYSEEEAVYHNYYDPVFIDMSSCLGFTCGQYWSSYDGYYNLRNLIELKNLNRQKHYDDNEKKQQLIQLLDNTNGNHFPFPFLKLNARHNDNVVYEELTEACKRRYLFDSIEAEIKSSNYNYTNEFTSDSFVDFNIIKVESIFNNIVKDEDVDLEYFKNSIKRQLQYGPLLIAVVIGSPPYNSAGILNIPEAPGGGANHDLILIGYDNNFIIILNSTPPNREETDIGFQHYITNNITFEVLYNNMKKSGGFKDNLYYVDIELPPRENSPVCSLGNIVQREQIPALPSPGLDASHIYGWSIMVGAPLLMACAVRRSGRKSSYTQFDITDDVDTSDEDHYDSRP